LDSLWKKTIRLLPVESGSCKKSGLIARLLRDLEQIRDKADAFSKHDELISWIETDRDDTCLCAIPKNLNERLFNDQWKKGIPTILTSGTLSAAGDFSHVKRTLGLEGLGDKLTETSKPSPFNHRENGLLYISDKIPFPDYKDKRYITAVTDEVERLI
jgi:ATP-dependent DNA helicase DinG